MLLTFRAHAEAQNERHNERVWLAWNTAALSRAKRMPDIKRLLISPAMPKRKRVQPWQEQMAIMDQWVAATRRKRWQGKSASR